MNEKIIKYNYKARDHQGVGIKGSVEALDELSAKKKISDLNLIPIEVWSSPLSGLSEYVEKIKKNFIGKVPLEDMLVFNRQLQTIYAVGIPLVRGLNFIHDQSENKNLKNAIRQIINEISEGSQLYSAMGKFPEIFDSTYINLVKAGEASGQLEALLDRISVLSETKAENRAKVKSALFYPKIVVGFLSLVFFVVVYYVIPKVSAFYGSLGAELPLVTRFVVGLSDFFIRYAIVIFIILFLIYSGIKKILSTENGKYKWDQFKLKLPIFGSLIMQIEMNSFAIVLGLLLKSGITLLEAFSIVKDSLNNFVIITEIERCRKMVESGTTLQISLTQSAVFPSMVTNLIAIGEEAGSLEEVLSRIANYYKLQVDYKLNNLSKAIEPILLFIIFGVVLILALALFLPMWQMSAAIRK